VDIFLFFKGCGGDRSVHQWYVDFISLLHKNVKDVLYMPHERSFYPRDLICFTKENTKRMRPDLICISKEYKLFFELINRMTTLADINASIPLEN
jgi:hypothetical protein